MATIHPQRPNETLPSGWESRLDPRTGRYYFINHAEHTTTWEDPRMLHPQVQQPDGVSVQVDERLLMKLCMQFPTVEEGHIWQFLKQYHNRENVVISALMAEGHPRAQTNPTAHEQMIIHRVEPVAEPSPPNIDEALVHKLHSYFPNVDIDSIRNLVKKFDNQEHEVISSLVTGSWKGNRFPTTTPSSPKMKLRYLKLVFPEVDEAVLFDILYNCDNNAYEASNRLSAMGYKKRDTPIIRPNANQQPKPTAEESRPKKPDRPVVVGPPSISDKHLLMSRIQEQFPAVSKTLVNMALDSSNYNEERAIQFLKAMTPMDGWIRLSDEDMKLLLLGRGNDSHAVHLLKTSNKFPTSESAPVISVEPTAAVEAASPTTSTGITSTVSSPKIVTTDADGVEQASTVESVEVESESSKPKEIIVSSPSFRAEGKQRSKLKKDVPKVTRSTSITLEEQQPAYVSFYRTKAKGPDASLRKGPCEDLLLYVRNFKSSLSRLKDYIPWVGADPKNRRGADASLHRGPDPKNLGNRDGLAKGPCRDHRRGPLADITHALRASRVTD